MNIKYLSDIRNFIGKLMDPVERNKTFYPLTLSPVEIANVIDKLQGIYDSPTDTPHDGNTVSIESSINLIDCSTTVKQLSPLCCLVMAIHRKEKSPFFPLWALPC